VPGGGAVHSINNDQAGDPPRRSKGPKTTFRNAEKLPAIKRKVLTRDEAFLIAVNIAKLPSVPRQILKDIPRRQLRRAGTTSYKPGACGGFDATIGLCNSKAIVLTSE
jgi:hypothetical protein